MEEIRRPKYVSVLVNRYTRAKTCLAEPWFGVSSESTAQNRNSGSGAMWLYTLAVSGGQLAVRADCHRKMLCISTILVLAVPLLVAQDPDKHLQDARNAIAA